MTHFHRDDLAPVSLQKDKSGSRKTSLDAVAITVSLVEITWGELADKQGGGPRLSPGFSKVVKESQGHQQSTPEKGTGQGGEKQISRRGSEHLCQTVLVGWT